MALHICNCFALSNRNVLKQNPNPDHNPIPLFSSSKSKEAYVVQRHAHPQEVFSSPYFTKRGLSFSIVALLLNGFLPILQKPIFAQELEELKRYRDSKEGFTLLRPSSWLKVDKAGATAFFEEANNGSNNIGIVVNPVRLTTLGEFGSPQFVADKLIQAERRKESTKDAVVIGYKERSGQGDLQVYEFEYEIDSTRGGMKRIFSAAFVASKKLYLINIIYSDKPESPLDSHTRTMLQEVLHSFDALPLLT